MIRSLFAAEPTEQQAEAKDKDGVQTWEAEEDGVGSTDTASSTVDELADSAVVPEELVSCTGRQAEWTHEDLDLYGHIISRYLLHISSHCMGRLTSSMLGRLFA